MSFRVRRLGDRQIVPGIPTPRLIEAGPADAFERDGIWYLREDGTMHVSPDGQYTRVNVEHTEDFRVDVTIQPVGPEAEQEQPYEDYFIVEAASDSEASRLAMTAAHEDVASRYGDDWASDVSVIRTRRGVSI